MKRIFAMLVVLMMAGMVSATTLSLSDDELSTEFARLWGPATVTITDIPGPGVRFDFSGLGSSGTGVGDNFEVSEKAGGAFKNYSSVFSTYGDFTGYDKYSMSFTNTGNTTVTVNLYMNTGWTDPPWSPARDTFWQNGWTSLGPGETEIVTLDFSSAEVYGASDDPNPAWRHSDGTTGVQVRRLDEVSNIGIQVLGDDDGSIVVSLVREEGPPAPEFGSLAMVVAILLATPAFAYLIVKRTGR